MFEKQYVNGGIFYGQEKRSEKAVITAPNETQKPFFESKETLPVGQLSIFDYM